MISPETLRRYSLFAGQSNYMLEEIAMLGNSLTLEPGEWLFHEGDPALQLYIIVDGAISLTMTIHLNGSKERIQKMSSIGGGEIVGWSSLLLANYYRFGAQASKKTQLLEISGEGLGELLDDNPRYGYLLIKKITEIIAERLESKCTQLLSLVV
jgi:CRP-like cAMP-binding protein